MNLAMLNLCHSTVFSLAVISIEILINRRYSTYRLHAICKYCVASAMSGKQAMHGGER